VAVVRATPSSVDESGKPWYTQGFALRRDRAQGGEHEREALLAQSQWQNERLLELDRVKDEFIALVSHELRTPLTSIRGYLELVVDDAAAAGLPVEQQEWLQVIDRNAERLLSLVEDLLISAQAHSGTLTLARPRSTSAPSCATVRRRVHTNAAAREIGWSARSSPACSSPAMPTRIAQVVDNLVSERAQVPRPAADVSS